MDRGDGRFVIHESFKDLKARRAEQEAYRKALEEQIMQRKKMQEEEREREKYEHRKLLQMTNENSEAQKSYMMREQIQPPSAYRSPQLNLSKTQQYPTPRMLPQMPPSPKFQGEGRILQNFNAVDNFNEPHPAAFDPNMEQPMSNWSACDGSKLNVLSPCPPAAVPVPNIPPDCMRYLQQVMPGFSLPNPMHLPPQEKEPMIPAQCQLPATPHSAPPTGHGTPLPAPAQYTDQPFSSGTSSESSSYENVVQGKQTLPPPKIHVSQTSDQIISSGVNVSRTQYRAELQMQIDERRRREEENRKKEQEEEERMQEKIRMEQEKMQREYEEELKKQQEKELEAEKKRLETLGKHNEAQKIKAEQKMIAKHKKYGGQPPSQREATNVKMMEHDDEQYSTEAYSSESTESIQSICDFFDTTTSETQEQKPAALPTRAEKFINPDDRIVPVVANKLKEEAQRKSLENSKRDSNGESFWISANQLSSMPPSSNDDKAEEIKEDETGSRGRSSLTARVSSVFRESHHDGKELPGPKVVRELAIRSAPCPTTDSSGNQAGAGFLKSLISRLQNEKIVLNDIIEAKGSKSNEGF